MLAWHCAGVQAEKSILCKAHEMLPYFAAPRQNTGSPPGPTRTCRFAVAASSTKHGREAVCLHHPSCASRITNHVSAGSRPCQLHMPATNPYSWESHGPMRFPKAHGSLMEIVGLTNQESCGTGVWAPGTSIVGFLGMLGVSEVTMI